MLNCFPQSHKANFDAIMHGFSVACEKFETGAIKDIANKYFCGSIPGQSKTFAPSPAEFASEVSKVNLEYDGMERRSAIEQRNRYLESQLGINSKQSEHRQKTPESKARVAAFVEEFKRAGAVGSDVPNFSAGTIEERQDKVAKYNEEGRVSREKMAQLLIKSKNGKARS